MRAKPGVVKARGTMATVLWYPAEPGSQETSWNVAIFHAGRNARGAPLAGAPARMPLVLLSHGTGGSAASLAWLAEALAAQGFIVAAVNHHGNTSYESQQRLEAQLAWWDRPRDLTVVLDQLLADPAWGPRIDTARVGVAGFSIGGYTALALVGARLSQQRWRDHCIQWPQDAPCKLPPEASGFKLDDAHRMLAEHPRIRSAKALMEAPLHDARVSAAFAIAPVLVPLMTPESLAAVAVPVALVVGAEDDQSLPARNVELLARQLPRAQASVLPGVTHYTFLAPCTLSGRWVAPAVCIDPAGVDRLAVHRNVAAQAVEFFQRMGPAAR